MRNAFRRAKFLVHIHSRLNGQNVTAIRWFSITLGTGIVSILLHNLPYNGSWLYWISVIMFVLNVFLFSVFLLISILRYAIYPEIWFVMIRHPSQSLFIGTFPVGLATIINMIVFVCIPAWGSWAIYLVGAKLYAYMQIKMLTALGLGIVVAGRCDSCLYVLLPPICNVSRSAHFPKPIFPTERLSWLITSIKVCTVIKPSFPR